MRGMEEILLDLTLNRSFIEELIERLADDIIRTMEIFITLGDFDGIAVSDDYGTQKGLLMSPDTWREVIKPQLARIYAFGKSHGKTVFHHSCGHVIPIIPDMIDIGLDILHPIQPEAMDVHMLKREFGEELTFCGGLRTQAEIGKLTSALPSELSCDTGRA